MPFDLAKVAMRVLALNAIGVLALNRTVENTGNDPSSSSNKLADHESHTGLVPDCPSLPDAKYHGKDTCMLTPSRPSTLGDVERPFILNRLRSSGNGATLVPNQQTVICPVDIKNLEDPTSVKGFDTTWIVENTASTSVVLSWVVNGVEWSPFQPDIKPMDDPRAILKPEEWAAVPAFESFVYHVREIGEDGKPGRIVLQHRAGLVPLGNPNEIKCDASVPDVEPIKPDTAERDNRFARTETPPVRPCNTIDIGFRNQVGCPLHVYWANSMTDVPTEGFSCAEQFKFHLGTKPATQDFFRDWKSYTKWEGSFIGHTYVARLASDPKIVIDSHTLQPTRIMDCPSMKQKVATASKDHAEYIVGAEGMIQPLHEEAAVPAAIEVAGLFADGTKVPNTNFADDMKKSRELQEWGESRVGKENS